MSIPFAYSGMPVWPMAVLLAKLEALSDLSFKIGLVLVTLEAWCTWTKSLLHRFKPNRNTSNTSSLLSP